MKDDMVHSMRVFMEVYKKNQRGEGASCQAQSNAAPAPSVGQGAGGMGGFLKLNAMHADAGQQHPRQGGTAFAIVPSSAGEILDNGMDDD